MDRPNGITIDAVPHNLPITFTEHECPKFMIEDLLSEFSEDDYKSAFFLLIDYILVEGFFKLTSKSLPFLKKAFIELYHECLDESILVEVLGVLKMYKKLRILGTCSHVYKSKEKYNDKIDRFWKMLYALCEELTDDQLNTFLKQYVEPDFKDKILSTEDWFCWAIRKHYITKENVCYLEEMFRNFPKILNILKNYTEYQCDCGIALIFNYENFNKNTGLRKRQYSHKDVDSLKRLWETFGFQVEIHPNLTYEETFQMMEYYGSKDYDSAQYDVCICCILSHGDSDAVYSSDGELMEIKELINPIVNCSQLKDKPKLFFIQACQGHNIPEGVGKPIHRLQTVDVQPKKPKKRYSSPPPLLDVDTLIVKSSIDGFVSFIDNEGSWFIQSLCDLMMENGEKYSVEDVMTMVYGRVKNRYSTTLDKLALNHVQTVHQNVYSDNCEQSNDQRVIQLVDRKTTLEKKLFLKKRH